MSGRKNFLGLPSNHLISATSMGASITSSVFLVTGLDNIGVQLNFTGTPTGTFTVDVSADYYSTQGAVINSGNFVSLDLNPVPTASGSAGNIVINLQGISFPWMRVRYVRTGGTGTLDCYVCGKML